MRGNVAVIGAGNWGKNLVRVFCELLGEKHVVVCDLAWEKLLAIEGRHPGVGITEDLGTVLRDPEVEALVLATPAATHFELAKEALLAGKHLLVEKPLALELAQAKTLIALAQQEGRVLMVDHLLEYHPAVETLKGLLEEGELGQAFCLHSQRLNLGLIRDKEDALLSLGPHDVAVFLYLLGQEPVTVSARGRVCLQRDRGIADFVFLDLEFPDGVMGHAHLSWLDPQKVRRVVVVGSRRMAVFDDTVREKLKLYDYSASYAESGWETRLGAACAIELSPEEPLRRMAQHFVQSVNEGTAPRSDGWDGFRVLRVLAAARCSMDRGGYPVELESV